MFNLKKEKKEMKTKVKNANCYSYENNNGDLVTNIDLNLYESNALNVEGKNESSIIRFRNKSVFVDAVFSNIENVVIYGELSILKDEYTTDELCSILCPLLCSADLEITQNVISKNEKNEDLGKRAFVDTQINSITLNKNGIKAYYMALAKIEGVTDIEQIKAKIAFALED